MQKVVLITGASSGIGRASAMLLAKDGFIVYGTARRLDKLGDLKDAGVRVLKMDVTDDASMVKGVNEILESEKHIDILINNAGYGSFGALEDVPISEGRRQFEVNLFGMARLIQLVLPHMRKRGSGRIINISSMGGVFAQPHGAWYHATKYAVEGLSDSLRMELRQFGINVVVIQPGAIRTEWSKIARQKLKEVSGKSAYKNLALRHIMMLENIDEKRSSGPIVIARVIEKAAIAENPRTRYVAGSGARLLMSLKRVLPDKVFDKLVLSQMK